jgi:flavin-dependent dehydrogenase
VGDAWAATNPTLGRGISIGSRHARLLRDVVREVGTDDHEKLVRRFDEETQTHQTPWYRSTVWHDRHRTADFQQAIAGTERQPDELWDRFLAFEHAAFGDMALLPHFLSTFRLDRRSEDILTDPEVVAHLEAAGHQPRTTGPTRAELLSAIAGA